MRTSPAGGIPARPMELWFYSVKRVGTVSRHDMRPAGSDRYATPTFQLDSPDCPEELKNSYDDAGPSTEMADREGELSGGER